MLTMKAGSENSQYMIYILLLGIITSVSDPKETIIQLPRVTVWNLAPILNPKLQKDSNVPKMLCQVQIAPILSLYSIHNYALSKIFKNAFSDGQPPCLCEFSPMEWEWQILGERWRRPASHSLDKVCLWGWRCFWQWQSQP